MASVIGWISGILTLLVLFSYPADFASDDHRLLIAIATLTAFMVNVGLPFSAGEINSAHTVGIMAYLLLASPANALWIVVIGALVGVIIRDARRHYGKTWQDFFGTVWESSARSIGQLVLSLSIGGWVYGQLDGQLPLEDFGSEDILPICGFIAGCLAVYLALLIVQIRSQHQENFRTTMLLNWQSMVAVLLVPVPIGVIATVAYYLISNLAFAILSGNLALIAAGIYGLSRTQYLYEQQLRDLSTLAIISNAMRTNLTLESLLRTLYLQVATLMDVQNFTVALYDPHRDLIQFPIHVRNGETKSIPAFTYENTLEEDRDTRGIFRYLVQNATQLNLIPADLPDSAWMGVPFLTSEQTIGTIIVAANNYEREFDTQDQQLLSTIAAQAGVALDNAQLYEQSRNRANRLRTLTRVSTELSSTLNPQLILDQIVELAQEVMGANAAAIFMWEPEKSLSTAPSLVRQVDLGHHFLSNPALPIIAQDTQRSTPLVIADSHKDPLAIHLRPILDMENKWAWIEIFMRHGAETLGILLVYFNNPYHPSEEDIEILQTYANQAALAVNNAQLYSNKDAHLRRRIDQLSQLELLGQELFSSRINLIGIYEQVLKRAVEGTSAHAGILFLKEDENQSAHPVAMLGYSSEKALDTARLNQLTYSILENADSIIIRDTSKEKFAHTLHPQTRAVLSVPILYQSDIIGAILLESKQPNAFGNEDLIFVIQVGSQIRIAVNNATLIRSIESTRDRLQTILDSMTEAMLLIDTAGYIRLANLRVSSILGLDSVSLMNQSITDLLQYTNLAFADKLGFEPHTLHEICRGLQTGDWQPHGEQDTYTRLLNGQLRYIERTNVAVRDQKNTVIGWLIVFVDVTEEHELAQARQDLYSMIIHDLRSPLTAIQASIKLIHNIIPPDTKIRPIVEQTTDTAGRAVRKLLNLVNSLLDIAKIESGTMTLEYEHSSLAQISASVIQELAPLAQEMEVELKNQVALDLPALEMDADKIERVIWNLVDNAIKFTPSHGQVQIKASPEADSNLVKIEIIDNGPGIPDEHKNRLFERYAQIAGQAGRRRGTGLGLTFCRLAVEAHHGQIWVEDNPQGGSIFCFTLPISKANTPLSS